MKTLNETINEVMNNGKSLANKRENLKKIGCLSQTDITIIINNYKKNHPEALVPSFKFAYTYGVEIETYGMSRDDMYAAANRNALNIQYQGYNHTDSHTIFKFVTDASISGANGIECVTPVLKGEKSGFDSLKNCCKCLNEAGAKVNKSTGLHVHIGCEGMTDAWYVNVFKNYKMLEMLIDTFMAESRRAQNGYYCRSLSGVDLSYCTTIRDVEVACARDHNATGARYHKVNPCSWGRHQTIEFRQHQGTTDYSKISHWVKFCAKLVGWSKSNVLTEPILTIENIPFLTAAEKAFFKSRKIALNGIAEAA